MSSESEDKKWHKIKQEHAAISERLAGAGWIKESGISEFGAGFRLTEKGIKGMNQIYEALRPLDPHTMRQDHVMGLFNHFFIRDEDIEP